LGVRNDFSKDLNRLRFKLLSNDYGSLDKKFKKRQEKQAKESQEKPPEPSKSEKIRPSPVSWIVFFFTISMVLILVT